MPGKGVKDLCGAQGGARDELEGPALLDGDMPRMQQRSVESET